MSDQSANFDPDLIKQFDFRRLFNALGWDSPPQQRPYEVETGGITYTLNVAAYKRGVQILVCAADSTGRIPDYVTRQKIERKITSEVREHLIVFTDTGKTTQIWQWVAREPGRPSQYREITWRQGEQTDLLRQKLRAIAFTLDDEESLTVLGVAQRLGAGFDRDKVTKKFYTEFDKQRKAFTEFIEGIPRLGKEIAEDQRWYAAVLIDRLMFLWFLQEKLFLDGRKHYLQSRLEQHLAAATADSPSFYRNFLCPLFFRGFAEARTDANRAAIKAEFGDVPYLNGGLFARHQLEAKYGDSLDVADAAFSKLFAFFNQWDWHLDDRPLASGREVNPDVLGYIFEKFVNQKQMGAYYTKEDITEYIGKNTILPCLLAKVRAEHPGTFDALAWPLLQQSGDAYLYPAMLKGVDQPYPADIAEGLDTDAPNLLERRKPWNKRADDAASLPTEIWREAIARHQRTREVRAKIASGDLRDVGDLITYNLNIRQFVQDLIERCTDVALLKSFWFNLAGRLPRKSNEKFRHGLSVLDPTCGSGAFLFAALNILKPLYDATLRTLHAVRNDALIAGEKSSPEKWAEVDEILTRFATEKTDRAQSYAVIKHIIVNNLYGVDIEEQATEIAKLRLFLKLVALLEPGDDIEPLPDIDFNIRHGNTLVGYATAEETERAVKGPTQGNLFHDAWEDIRLRLIAVEQQYNNFQIQQVQRGGHVSPADKQALDNTLHDLEETLNYHLAREYGVNPRVTGKYQAWKASHQPFHWFVDFYPLMAAGGFDAVIGNPPYVETAKILDYKALNLPLWSTGNLFAVCVERFTALQAPNSFQSVIIPISAIATPRMLPLVDHYETYFHSVWVSSYAVRPGKLFVGVDMNLCVVTGRRFVGSATGSNYTSSYLRWSSEQRASLFDTVCFTKQDHLTAKIGDPVLNSIVKKATGRPNVNESILRSGLGTHDKVYVHSGGRYFRKCALTQYSNEYKPLSVPCEWRHSVAAALSSSTFYVVWLALSDCFHVTKRDIDCLKADRELLSSTILRSSGQRLLDHLVENSVTRVRRRKDGSIQNEVNFRVAASKELIDLVDVAMASYYGFSADELDYIISYDIKYRMGQSVDDDGDD